MPYTLLVADHDPLQFELFDMIFHADGYRLKTFADGQDVLAYLREHTPDLAILETGTPSVDGFELCRKMKSIKRLKEVPIVLVTSQEVLSDEVKELAKIVKADLIIPKPLGDKNLRSRVQTLLAGRTPQVQETYHPQKQTEEQLKHAQETRAKPEQNEVAPDETLVEELHALERERRRLHAELLPTDRSQEPKEMKKLRALIALQEEQIEKLGARRQELEARLSGQKEPSRLRRWLP